MERQSHLRRLFFLFLFVFLVSSSRSLSSSFVSAFRKGTLLWAVVCVLTQLWRDQLANKKETACWHPEKLIVCKCAHFRVYPILQRRQSDYIPAPSFHYSLLIIPTSCIILIIITTPLFFFLLCECNVCERVFLNVHTHTHTHTH